MQRATCCTRLGHVEDAARLWGQILPRTSSAVRRDLGHHFDATLGYKSVLISISSSDLGGYVAEHDIELARRIEAAAGAAEQPEVAPYTPPGVLAEVKQDPQGQPHGIKTGVRVDRAADLPVAGRLVDPLGLEAKGLPPVARG